MGILLVSLLLFHTAGLGATSDVSGEGAIETDGTTYVPEDSVNIEVYVSNANLITIQIEYPNGSTFFVDTIHAIPVNESNPSLGDMGLFTFMLPPDSPEGNYTVYCGVVSVDDGSGGAGERENLYGTFIVEEMAIEQADSDTPFIPIPYVAGTLVFSGMFVCVWISERGRYLLFSMIILPLYTRLKNDVERDLEQQNNRGRIYQHIKDCPGVTLNLIKDAVETGNGTTVYHLKVLEKDGRIVRTGNHYFIRGAKPLTYNEMKQPFSQRENAVIHYLLTHGKSEERTIHTDLRETQSSVNRDLKSLLKFDIVMRTKIGLTYRYFLTQNYLNWHSRNYKPSPARITHTCPGCGNIMSMRNRGVCLNCGRRLT